MNAQNASQTALVSRPQGDHSQLMEALQQGLATPEPAELLESLAKRKITGK